MPFSILDLDGKNRDFYVRIKWGGKWDGANKSVISGSLVFSHSLFQ